MKQQLAVKNYNEKVLQEQLAIKERELAEVDLRNRQLIFKLDKEKNKNLKLSGELRRKSVTSGSANPDPNARPPLPSLRDTGTIPKSASSESRNQQSEQSRTDREARKSRLQPDLNYDFRSRQGDFFTSSPAYTGLTLLEGESLVASHQMIEILPDPFSQTLERLELTFWETCPPKQIYLTPVIHLKV